VQRAVRASTLEIQLLNSILFFPVIIKIALQFLFVYRTSRNFTAIFEIMRSFTQNIKNAIFKKNMKNAGHLTTFAGRGTSTEIAGLSRKKRDVWQPYPSAFLST
jgi:hypothetical protein